MLPVRDPFTFRTHRLIKKEWKKDILSKYKPKETEDIYTYIRQNRP